MHFETASRGVNPALPSTSGASVTLFSPDLSLTSLPPLHTLLYLLLPELPLTWPSHAHLFFTCPSLPSLVPAPVSASAVTGIDLSRMKSLLPTLSPTRELPPASSSPSFLLYPHHRNDEPDFDNFSLNSIGYLLHLLSQPNKTYLLPTLY